MTARPPLAKKHYYPSDFGNARRLVAKHGHDLRWIERFERWYVWDGRRWKMDETGQVIRWAKGVTEDMLREALDADGDERTKLLKEATKAQGMGRLKSMIECAQSEEGIPIVPEDLDQHTMLLNLRNGTLDLASGQLMVHSRMHLCTKCIDLDYDPDARSDTWQATLLTLMGGDANLVEYLQRALGYSLTGDTRERVLHLCVGTGSNGKSTILDLLADMMGDYGVTADFNTFLDGQTRSGSGASPDIARLAGARMVRTSEVGENKKLNEGLVKSMTGSDIITARHLHKGNIEFKPMFKLWMAANHKPVIRGTDYAIWQRIRLIPFEVTILPEQRDDSLPGRLLDELEGILAWCVEGATKWLEVGLHAPARILDATKEYRAESDTIGTFIHDRCVVGEAYSTSGGELYRAYHTWAKDNGEYIVSSQMFGRRLTERGFISSHTMYGKQRRGLKLVTQTSSDTTDSHY